MSQVFICFQEKKADKKLQQNGGIGATPLPPIQDSKMKEDVEMYKKKNTEQERKLNEQEKKLVCWKKQIKGYFRPSVLKVTGLCSTVGFYCMLLLGLISSHLGTFLGDVNCQMPGAGFFSKEALKKNSEVISDKQ